MSGDALSVASALGGIEFHAKASCGLSLNIMQNLKTKQDTKDIRHELNLLECQFRRVYVAVRAVGRADELAALNSRKEELLAEAT